MSILFLENKKSMLRIGKNLRFREKIHSRKFLSPQRYDDRIVEPDRYVFAITSRDAKQNFCRVLPIFLSVSSKIISIVYF